MEKIQLRRDSAAAWTTNNPVLASGEAGIELNATPGQVVKFKIGDGVSAWNDLPYQNDVLSPASLSTNTFTGKQIAPIVSSATFLDKTVVIPSANFNTALDVSVGSVFEVTTAGDIVFSLSNIPTLTNETLSFVVRVSQGANAYTLTWWSGISWLTPSGLTPDAPAANKTIEYIFTTKDGIAFIGRKGASN